jgi:hypothetical protein
MQLKELAERAAQGESTRKEVDAALAEAIGAQRQIFGSRPRAKKGEGGGPRILDYLKETRRRGSLGRRAERRPRRGRGSRFRASCRVHGLDQQPTQSSGVLPLMMLSRRVTVPRFKMPPPSVVAWLSVTVLSRSVRALKL